MPAVQNLPEVSFHPKAELGARSIVEVAGAQWLGLQETNDVSLVMFRDPVTGSSCALSEQGFSAAVVSAKLESKRAEFGASR